MIVSTVQFSNQTSTSTSPLPIVHGLIVTQGFLCLSGSSNAVVDEVRW
jgi:hypothetical protein